VLLSFFLFFLWGTGLAFLQVQVGLHFGATLGQILQARVLFLFPFPNPFRLILHPLTSSFTRFPHRPSLSLFPLSNFSVSFFFAFFLCLPRVDPDFFPDSPRSAYWSFFLKCFFALEVRPTASSSFPAVNFFVLVTMVCLGCFPASPFV